MTLSDPLLAAWERTLTRKRDRPAIFGANGESLRTFHDIENGAQSFAARIETFSAGDVLAVQIGNHEDWPAILIACLRSKMVVLPLEQSLTAQQRDAVFQICKATAVVSAVSSGKSSELHRLRTPKDRGQAANATADWNKNPPSLLKLTSGTTAAPRAVRFRSEQLLADCNQICQTMGISDVDLNFGVIPISHSYGFSNLLTPLIARGVPMVLSRDRTPRAVLVDLARSGATVFPGMPLFYQAFCEMEAIPDLSKLRLCISAGAPLSRTIAKNFRAKFGLSIHSFYGASESGGICFDRDGTRDAEGFVGHPMEGVDADIVDPAAPSSQIRVRSAAVGDAYFPESDGSKLGDGVFTPDDLLTCDGSGFRIVGRTSDLINVAGKKVNPAEVESHLLRFNGIRQAVVFGRESALRNEEVAACVVAEVAVRESDLLEFCRANLSGWQTPKRIFIVDAIPTNERGKISRRALGKLFSA